MSYSVDAAFGPLRAMESWLWVVAVVFYGVGDSVTTYVGLNSSDVAEAGPVAVHLLDGGGIGALVVLKLALFVTCFGVWRVARTPGRIAIPLALAVTGLLVTTWNAAVIVS